MTAPTLETFIEEVAEIVERGGTEHDLTERVAERLRVLLDGPAFLGEELTRADPDHYVMYPLHVDPAGRFSIASAVWDVGQGTPIHDHQTWGVIGIYSGVERERRYEPVAGAAPRFLDESELRTGEVCVCCTTDRDLHAVACGSPVPCVGIHVYGADIGTITRYAHDERTGARKPFVSRWPARPDGRRVT